MKRVKNIWIKVAFWSFVFAFLILGLIGSIDSTDTIGEVNFIKDDAADILSIIGIVGALVMMTGYIVYRTLLSEGVTKEIAEELIEEEKDHLLAKDTKSEEPSKEVELLSDEGNNNKE